MRRTRRRRGVDPIDVSETCWLYAEADGLCVVQEIRDGDRVFGTVIHTIPWKTVEAALNKRDHHNR